MIKENSVFWKQNSTIKNVSLITDSKFCLTCLSSEERYENLSSEINPGWNNVFVYSQKDEYRLIFIKTFLYKTIAVNKYVEKSISLNSVVTKPFPFKLIYIKIFLLWAFPYQNSVLLSFIPRVCYISHQSLSYIQNINHFIKFHQSSYRVFFHLYAFIAVDAYEVRTEFLCVKSWLLF
jgi:hypothetical protein